MLITLILTMNNKLIERESMKKHIKKKRHSELIKNIKLILILY
jgi:hypothetical protein